MNENKTNFYSNTLKGAKKCYNNVLKLLRVLSKKSISEARSKCDSDILKEIRDDYNAICKLLNDADKVTITIKFLKKDVGS